MFYEVTYVFCVLYIVLRNTTLSIVECCVNVCLRFAVCATDVCNQMCVVWHVHCVVCTVMFVLCCQTKMLIVNVEMCISSVICLLWYVPCKLSNVDCVLQSMLCAVSICIEFRERTIEHCVVWSVEVCCEVCCALSAICGVDHPLRFVKCKLGCKD